MEENYQPPRTNGKAIAALVLGICSIVVPYIGLILGIIGIILSSQAFKVIKRTKEGGHGMAVAGLVCSIIGVCIYAIVIIIVIIAFIAYSAIDSTYYY